MSASLVGSEMCIRDRLLPLPVCSSRDALCKSPKWNSPGRHVLSSAWAVSYTHLTLPTICSV
eukprot:12038687-Alexandrium_andersonii.AAC.1